MIKSKKFKLVLTLFISLNLLSYTTHKKNKDHDLTTRKFQGIPSMAISHQGNLWATWYAGKTPGEDQNNYVVLANSTDNGESWTENMSIDPDGDGPLRAFDPQVWLDPNGKLWVFWAETIGHDGANARLMAKTNSNPDRKDSKWTESFRVSTGVMMCKPTILSNGDWLLPVSTWRETDNSARVIVSTDQGKTFSLRGYCHIPKEIRDYDEHMIVERKDKSLWMLIRTKGGISESVSKDSGKTWSTPVPSSIEHPPARSFVRRLQSGNILLVKHGQVNEKIGRSHLMAFISKDEGHSWSKGLLLDKRNGVSYPDGQQDKDGVIHIIYDHSRTKAREILMAKFTEEDIFSGNGTSESLKLEMTVSKYSDLGLDFKKIFIDKAIVKLISRKKENEIRYTTDGSEPDKNSILYTEPFTVTKSTRLTVKEFKTGGILYQKYAANYIKQNPLKATKVNHSNSGLSFTYFEFVKPINSVKDLQTLQATKKGSLNKFVFPDNGENLNESFGLIYNGFINIPKEDVYEFSVLSNDGSHLFIDNELVVDNDGLHGATEVAGEIPLQKGWHKISLSYFQAGGGKNLKVFWKNSEFERKEISEENLSGH